MMKQISPLHISAQALFECGMRTKELLTLQSQQTAREIVDEIETKKVNEWDDIPCGECGKPRGQSRNEKNTEFNQALSTLQDSIKKRYELN